MRLMSATFSEKEIFCFYGNFSQLQNFYGIDVWKLKDSWIEFSAYLLTNTNNCDFVRLSSSHNFALIFPHLFSPLSCLWVVEGTF